MNVLISISTKIGVAPSNAIASAVAKYVKGEVNIASPGPTPLAIRAIINASVPDEHEIACLTLANSANLFSNSDTSGPRIY